MINSYLKIIAVLMLAQALNITKMNAQNERSMYYMNQIPQASYGNPAFIPSSNIYVSIPVIASNYVSYNNSGFRFNDVISKRVDDSLVLDQNKFLKAIGNDNDIRVNAQKEIAAFGFRTGKNYFSLSFGIKENFNFHYTKDLMSLLINGNAPLIGKPVDLSGSKAFGMVYFESALGFAREINSNLRVGVRLKHLFGVMAINTQDSRATLTTNPNTYALTAISDIKVDYANSTNNENKFDPMGATKNQGFAFDLGVDYKVTEKLSVNASLLDIGSIRWKEKVSNFISTAPNNSFTFNGIAINNLFSKNGSSDSTFSHLLDTLKNKFNVVETHNSFKTNMVKRLNIGAAYQLDDKNLAGINIRNEFFIGDDNPSITLSLNHQFNQILSGTVSYSYIDKTYTNIGAGFALNLGTFQMYAVMDNVISPMQVKSMQSVNVQFGFNLVFGNNLKKLKKTEKVNQTSTVIIEPQLTKKLP